MLQNSTAAPITHSRHSSAVPTAHIGGPMRPARRKSTQSGLGCSNAKRAAPGLQPRRHGPHGTRTAASTHCTVSPCCIGRAATPQCGTVRARGGVECRHKGLPAHPALPRCNQGRPPRSQPASGHTHHAVLFKVCGGPGWSACVRPLRGAPQGLQLGSSPGPVPGRRTAPTLRAQGPPRAPHMHLNSCYMAEAGGAVHLPHHGPRNRQTAVFSHRANGGKPP
jgi:hypothetical protein